MNFKELLLQAKFGDRTATTELLMLAKFLQVTGQIMLQFLLPHTENIIKSNHLAPPSAAVTEVLWQNALPMMRQMLQTLQAAHGSSDAR